MKNALLLIAFIFTLVMQYAWSSDLTLDMAISESLHESPKVQTMESKAMEAHWKKIESYSGFLPTLTVQGNYLTNKKYLLTNVQLAGSPSTTAIPQIIPTSLFTAQALLPLFDGFASSNRLWSNQALEKSAASELDWSRFVTQREVTLQFYRTLSAKTLKEVAEQNLATLEDHLKDVQLFKKAGMSTNFDVLRVEVQVSEAKSEVLNTSDNIEINKQKLAEILGHLSEDREVQGTLPVLEARLVENMSFEDIQRKDLEALQLKSSGMDYLAKSNNRYWVPRLSLFGQYQYYNNLTNSFSDTDYYRNAYQAGLQLTWNIFDGMSSIAKSKQTVEQKVQAEKGYILGKLKAKQDFELWKRKFVYFCSIYKARISDVAKATESVRLAREGRKVGARTNTDLLDAEGELFKARAGVVNAQIGAIEALVNLELASGQQVYTL